ncbi:DUF2309 domain-containing protein [Gemmata sp. JC673]|uniref:Probable inorganic carbon transporter subunit DabA n=1 Tax=Gemmata algarum TaxID=2975278 RepID=A0ABU5F989_9BACT|nr:DUF2309 domain-containing protein [Gemmata algarum]MDY3563764.1 DUF2309 domain-containing protein [Gemmata algarum]
MESATSLHALLPSGEFQESDLARLEQVIELSARLLPAEGPIGQFVFLNPLHAFEGLPFEAGVRVGGRLFGAETYLPEDQYRAALAVGRIKSVDLRAVLEEEPGAWTPIGDLGSRLDLWMALLVAPSPPASAAEVEWHLAEADALDRFLPATTVSARDQIVADVKRWAVRDLIRAGGADEVPPADTHRGHVLWPLLSDLGPLMAAEGHGREEGWEAPVWEAFAVRALWRVCLAGVAAAGPPAPTRAPERHRDVLLRATGVDTDELVHALLIGFCAAFTDQGMADWPLPNRERGFFACFDDLYGRGGGPPDRWLRGLGAELARLRAAGYGPMDSVRESLGLLGVPPEEWETFLPRTLLALRGWASLIRQMEVRADRVPQPARRGTLVEFLAVRLVLERLALAHVARAELGYAGPLSGLRAAAHRPAPPAAPEGRALAVFRLAQARGWAPSALHEAGPAGWAELVREIEAFSGAERRRVFHKAYERRFRVQALDALAARAAGGPRRAAGRPRFQVVCCIDAREESFRRHLEELCPDAETLGAPGFFGVPIYYRGAADAHPAAQCPIVIRPQHWVVEEPVYPLAAAHRSRVRARRLWGALAHRFHRASRRPLAGAVLTGVLGSLSTVPFVVRVLFPRLAGRLWRATETLLTPPPFTRLVLERAAPAPGPEGDAIGFNVEEMTNIAERLLRDTGLTAGFARLVFFFGHGSHSLNNPHLAAYHCGACSGNTGAANARALAEMLNDPRVRAGLAARGLNVPADTVFVGAFHNTGPETATYFDLDRLPRGHHADLEFAQAAVGRALELNAREKCRRFDTAPLNITPRGAHLHVQARVDDLAQTRAEYGNASNAMCVVGRRERVRGLFLDRRSFLQSYDPTQDTPDGQLLARSLAAVIPVCQGINLMYYFSRVAPDGLGAGSKLPHNIVGLLGVMNGVASDLRQGLPTQGVEIHEPMRILFVIETQPEVILGIMQKNPTIDRIVRNGWAQLALLDPCSPRLLVFQDGTFRPHHPSDAPLPTVNSSGDWYSGARDHLGFADVAPPAV